MTTTYSTTATAATDPADFDDPVIVAFACSYHAPSGEVLAGVHVSLSSTGPRAGEDDTTVPLSALIQGF